MYLRRTLVHTIHHLRKGWNYHSQQDVIDLIYSKTILVNAFLGNRKIRLM